MTEAEREAFKEEILREARVQMQEAFKYGLRIEANLRKECPLPVRLAQSVRLRFQGEYISSAESRT